jgi:hypothetical protein
MKRKIIEIKIERKRIRKYMRKRRMRIKNKIKMKMKIILIRRRFIEENKHLMRKKINPEKLKKFISKMMA